MANEVWAKLGVDTASVPGDLAKAKAAFGQFGQEIQSAGTKAGDATGANIAGAIEHHFIGNRAIASALGTALGLNLDKIAESITSALVGGTKEAWIELVKLADENTKLIEQISERNLTPKGLEEKHKKDYDRAVADFEGLVAKKNAAMADRGKSLGGDELGVSLADEAPNAEQEIAIETAKKAMLEAQLKVQADVLKNKDADKKLTESIIKADLTGLTYTEAIKALEEENTALTKEQESGKLTKVEIDERAARIGENLKRIEQEKNEQTKTGIELAKQLVEEQAKLATAQKKQADDEAKLANDRADRGKLTIGEIANLKPKQQGLGDESFKPVDTFGLSAEEAEAKERAVEIQRMQKKAEALRVSGDSGGANELLSQIDTNKETLVKSGFAKSSEGDQFKGVEEAINKDSTEVQKILNDINLTLQGQHKNGK